MNVLAFMCYCRLSLLQTRVCVASLFLQISTIDDDDDDVDDDDEVFTAVLTFATFCTV